MVKAVSTLYAGKFYPISRQQAVEFMSQFEGAQVESGLTGAFGVDRLAGQQHGGRGDVTLNR